VNWQSLNPAIVPRDENDSRGSTLRSIVRKSALLNLAIVLTSFPVLVCAGGPNAVVPTLAIMAGISAVIWAATFAIYSFISLTRLFMTPVTSGKQLDPPHPANDIGVADRWMDSPF
jgi:hypothetical protein